MRNRHLQYIGLLLLPISSFALYNWIYDYVIVSQSKTSNCFFIFGREYLQEFLDHPGGLLRYAARFLGQFYHYKWLGALTISVCITCFGVLFYLVQKKLKPTVYIFQTFFPCILLLALHTSITPAWKCPDYIQGTLGLVMTGGAFLGYLSLRRGVSRHIYALLATPFLYLLVGGYVWFFAVWATAWEWFDSPLPSNLVFKLLYPALTFCMPFAAYRWLFPISFRNAVIYPTIFVASYSWLVIVLYAYLLLMPFWMRISCPERLESFWTRRGGLGAQMVLLIGLAMFLLYSQYDSELSEFVDYHQLYKSRQWDAILSKAGRNPSREVMVQFFTNYALNHKGKLLEEMFDYPQIWGTRGLVLNFSSGDFVKMETMYNSDLFFEMGHMNAAFRCAYNDLASLGRSYQNLKRIAECNMVNGNYEIAEKYLNLLEKTLFHKEFAQRYKAIIADTDARDRCFAELRTQLPTVELDMYLSNFVPLLTLLISNPQNRLAFEYLTAWFLLDKASLPLIAENIQHLREAGYISIPTHCQEALMGLEKGSGSTIDLHGFTYDDDTVSRFKRFQQLVFQDTSRHEVQRKLESVFGGTYMYYYFFVRTMPSVPGSEAGSETHYLLGNALMSQGKFEAAAARYRQVARTDQDFVKARQNLDRIMRLGTD